MGKFDPTIVEVAFSQPQLVAEIKADAIRIGVLTDMSGTSVQWTQDAASTANAVVAGVSKKLNGPWFFITADYAFGHAVEASARAKLDKLRISEHAAGFPYSASTTAALPPPRRTGSAAASMRPPPRNSIPVAAPISPVGDSTCP